MCMTAALISLEAKRDLFHLLNLLSLHTAAASDTASAVPGKDQHAWARVPPQKQLQQFSPGDAPSWAESPLLQRAPGHLTAAKGLPALLSLPTGDCGGLRWSTLIFRLTPLTVCFPGYCLHQDHNRDINTADWSGGIKDTSTKTGGKCKRKRKHAFQLLIFDFHSALSSNGATAAHTSCAFAKCNMSSLGRAAGLSLGDGGGN